MLRDYEHTESFVLEKTPFIKVVFIQFCLVVNFLMFFKTPKGSNIKKTRLKYFLLCTKIFLFLRVLGYSFLIGQERYLILFFKKISQRSRMKSEIPFLQFSKVKTFFIF